MDWSETASWLIQIPGMISSYLPPLTWPVICSQYITGVVETGLFVNMATIAYFGAPDGSVAKKEI